MLAATDTYRIKGETLEQYTGSDLLWKFESVPVK